MPTTIIMPQLGESVAEGIIGKWLKQEGDHIDKDEAIVEVITDKVNAEIPSPVGGTLQRITQPEGATVAVGQEIAIIGDDAAAQDSEPAAAIPASGGNGSIASGPAPQSSPPAPAGPAQTGATATAIAPAAPAKARGERVRTSPLVKRLAEEYAIDLAEVPGTGIGGRVSKQDVMSFIEQKQQETAGPAPATEPAHFAPGETFERPAAQAPAAPSTPPAQPARPVGPREELVPVPPLRKMIAQHMVLSTSSIPHAATNHEVDVTNVARFREAHKVEFNRREGVPLSYVAFVIKATVEALKEFPYVNSEWAGENILLKHDININVAVDAPEGLTTPVIHHADERSLAGLSRAIHDLSQRARERKLRVEDMQGGTFTVNNTGALGSLEGVSIINYPQCGILSAGSIVKRPVVVEQGGQDLIAVRSMMILSFSFDHRILDGGSATGFVNAVKAKLESWSQDYPIY